MKHFFATILLVFGFCAVGMAQGQRIFLFDNFAKGAVYFHSGAANVSMMNYDANNGKMYFLQGAELMELTGVAQIDSIKFGERKFVQKNLDFVEDFKTEHGTVKILWRIHKIHDGYVGAFGVTTQAQSKKMQLGGNFGMGEISGTGGGMYNGSFGANNDEEGGRNLDVWRIKNGNVYYYTKNGKEYKAKKSKDVLKAFPDKKQQIQDYMHQNNLDMLNTDKALKIIDYVLTL